jgi:PAS domain S-box-containing protein
VDNKAYRENNGNLYLIPISLGIVAFIFGLYEVIERTWLGGIDMEVIHFLHVIRGVGSSLILAGFVAWYLLRRQSQLFLTKPSSQVGNYFRLLDTSGQLHQHATWLIDLRWVATTVATVLIIIACPITHILETYLCLPLLVCVATLALSNIFFAYWVPRSQNPYPIIICQIISDLIILTALLHFSGGIENPLFITYSFHVIIAGILLTKRATYYLSLVASGFFGILALGELLDFLPHYTIQLFPHVGYPVQHAAHNFLYVFGLIFPFMGFLFCTAYFITLIMDHLRKSEERLVETARIASSEQQKLESVVNAAGAGMILLNQNLEVQWFNQKVREWFGWKEDLVGKRCVLCNHTSQSTSHSCIASHTVQKGKVLEVERTVLEKPGQRRFYHITTSPILDERNKIVQIVELVQDITAWKLMEAEALHAGKMAALGRMAAGIAHEIGNPLSSLSIRLRRMEHSRDEGFLRDSLQFLRDQIARISRIVHGIMQFSRPPKEEWNYCQLNDILLEVLNVIKLDRRSKGIKIDIHLAEELPKTLGVKDQLAQVFLNIGLNAVEAMAGNGLLEVKTAIKDGEILVTFSDNGPGITPEVQTNLFTPFFTTKERGSGLGLAISYSIIHAHGGRIIVKSSEGQGTTFIVSLPIRQYEPREEDQELAISWVLKS